jgi:hypothetical protein
LEDPVNYEVFAEMFAVFATLLDVPFEIAFWVRVPYLRSTTSRGWVRLRQWSCLRNAQCSGVAAFTEFWTR